MIKKYFVLIMILVLITGIFTACGDKNNPDVEFTETTADDLTDSEKVLINSGNATKEGAFEIADHVYILNVLPYSGSYVEDGSDEEVKNIVSVVLYNASDVNYQLLDFKATIGGVECSFSATTVFMNSTTTILEKDRKSCPDDHYVLNATLTQAARFSETPTVHLDELKITYIDYFINVENLTDEAISNVYLYYKNADSEGNFLGGITYRVSFDTIEPGAISQRGASKFTSEGSKIVFVNYMPPESTDVQ